MGITGSYEFNCSCCFHCEPRTYAVFRVDSQEPRGVGCAHVTDRYSAAAVHSTSHVVIQSVALAIKPALRRRIVVPLAAGDDVLVFVAAKRHGCDCARAGVVRLSDFLRFQVPDLQRS